MEVTIWSDVMCPFCYIGKKNFEKALENLPFKDDVTVNWKSFQLDPTLEDISGNYTTKQYLMDKRGLAEAQIDQMQSRIAEMGKQVGIDFTKTSPIAANTLKAHQLLHLSKKYGKQNDAEELLFKAHFEEGVNIADKNVLIKIGNELGIATQEIEHALQSEEIAYEVKQDILEAQGIGVTGVPFFILNNKYAVNGAQPVENFIEALTQTYKETVTDLENQGMSCSIDGCE